MNRSWALRGVTVIDGLGGRAEDQVVVTEDGRITHVGPDADYVPRDGVVERDLAGLYVMPGLIDAHVHLAGGRADAIEQEAGLVDEPPRLLAMRSVYEAQAILRRGFTTVRDVSWNGLYLKRLFREGSIPGPKVIACGPGLTRTGGHGDIYQHTPEYLRERSPWGLVADGPHELVKAVRSLLREGADAIKIFASGGDNWPHDRNTDVHYSDEELRAAVEEAHRQVGTIVMCHAETREAIRSSIEAGVDTIEHGEDLDDELVALMVERGTILVPTLELIVNWHRDFIPLGEGAPEPLRTHAFLHRDMHEPRDEAFGEALSDSAVASYQRALKAGVRIALGSDTVFEPLTPYGEYSAREFRALVEHGMTVDQAIVAATSVGADAVGMGGIIGVIAPGMQADLLVVRKDPSSSSEVLYDQSNIHLTFCDGALTVVDGRFTC